MTSARAERQAKAEMSSCMEGSALENSTMELSHWSPRASAHCARCSATPLQNTNWSDSGRYLQASKEGREI